MAGFRTIRFGGSRWQVALVVVLVLAGLTLPAGVASAQFPANYTMVIDQGGANDVNASQVDLTQFGRDDSDPNAYKLLWSWDATDDWTGTGQTGDACALFDSDGDSRVNFAVCAQISNPGANPNVVTQVAGSPYAFTCNDARLDRCGQPDAFTIPALASGALDLLTGAILPSPPANLITPTDPFANLLPDQNWPNDSTVAINIAKSVLPTDAVLVNVCTYPSAGNGGNNNPFDCIINPGDGLLVIKKVTTVPTTQPFDFTVNPGNQSFQIIGTGQTPQIGKAPTSIVSVAETVPDQWVLDSSSCELEGGAPTGTKTENTVSGITIETGLITTCTFTDSPQPPDVSVVKTADAGTVSAGDQIGFLITVANAGPGQATGVTLTDTLPANAGLDWSIDGGTGAAQCSIATGELSCDFGTLASGESRTVHMSSPTTAASCGTVDNTATVDATNGEPDSDDGTVVVQCPGLNVAKSPDEGTVSAGDTIGFTITVSNAGPGTATGVTLSDDLPTGGGLVWEESPDVAACSISAAGVLSCDFGDLPAGESRTVHVTSPTTAASCAPVANTATADSSNGEPVSDTGNLVVQCPDISVEKTADEGTVSAGTAIGFTITVSNAGPGTAMGVTLADTLPTTAGLDWSIDADGSDPGCAIAQGVLSCDFGTLAADASKSVHITSPTTAASCATVENTATVDASNDDPLSDTGTLVVECPDISVEKTPDAGTVSAGDQIGFTITVSNAGPGTATGVTLTDTLPTQAGLDWSINGGNGAAQCSIAAGELSCDSGTLAAGASKSVHIVSPTTAASCATVDNTAAVSTSNDGGAQAEDEVVVNCGAIALSKTADAGTVSAGDQIGFVITATNAGDGEARAVTVTDTLPTGAGLVWSIAAGADAGCAISGGVLSCDWGTLAAGASKSVHIVSPTTAASCATVDNTAAVSTSNDGGAQAEDEVVVNCGAIALSKTADAGTVSAGDQIGFVITATNAGDGEARAVTVTDTLPTGAGLVWSIAAGADAGCAISGGVLSCDWGTLAAGASKSVHIVSPTTAASCATVDNTAAVSTSNDGGAQAEDEVVVNCGAIALSKTADAPSFVVGEVIGFKITATNTGDGEARNVTVTDTLPTTAGLSWSEAPDVAECAIAGGVLTCRFAALAPGASKSVHISSPTTAASCAKIDNTARVSTSNDGTDTASGSTQCVATTQVEQPAPVDQRDVRGIQQRGVSGRARMRGPSGCVKRPFRVVVRGSGIARVTFFVDGKQFKRVTRGPGHRRRFAASIGPRGLSFGVHRVTARVEFVAASGTKPRRLRLSFQRCKRQVVLPRYTG